MLWIQAQNGGGSEERIRNFVVERNWFAAPTAGYANTNITASSGTLRNNIFDLSAAGSGSVMNAGPATVCCAAASNLNYYNNTIYTSANTSSVVGVSLSAGTTGIVVKNNLLYAPIATGATPIHDGGSTAPTFANNTCNTSDCTTGVTTDPHFASATPASPVDFRPSTAGYGVNGGIAVYPATSDDFFHCANNASHVRMGAFEPKAEAIFSGVAGP